jgi:putative FmdB family regulatory protein
MPIYEYHCEKCGHEFEVLQKSFDVDEMPCETCGATAKRMISNTSFVLKGTGWYVTDYKSNGGCSAAGGNNGKSHGHGDKDAKSETPSAPSTPCASAGSNGSCASCSGAKASAPAASAGTAAN